MLYRERSHADGAKPSAYVVAACLTKLAKHLALIACFMIIGATSGRVAASETAIFLTVAAAALTHSFGRVLGRRRPPVARSSWRGP